MSETTLAGNGMGKHRLEALTDGIFAVAMTLLVIELKLPETIHHASAAELAQAVVDLLPKFISWLISFFVLGIYWYSHQRMFRFVRHIDGRLTSLSLIFLGLVSLLPFASALSGQATRALLSQVVYSSVMLLIGVASLWSARYVYKHPELCGSTPMPTATFRAARFRTLGLMCIAIVAVVIGKLLPGAGNMAFSLMVFISIIGRKMEAAGIEAPTQNSIPSESTPP
ncbi:MAG TPA: TMEM175 family protein [Usitatibacteraceae bacterium]